MHPTIFNRFEEIGAMPNTGSLLNMDALRGATDKIGINLAPESEYRDYKILHGNANHMDFPDAHFDVVLCNSVLEHDKYFWKSISEMRRVLKAGGLLVIGTPGYTVLRRENRIHNWFKRLGAKTGNFLINSTLTFQIHNHPGDYYRFSPQTYKDVFFEGMENVSVESLMIPPRIIGFGHKSHTK